MNSLRFQKLPDQEFEHISNSHSFHDPIQNAANFSPDGGSIHIEAIRKDDTIQVKVSDEGPGLPDYAIPRVFDRFYSLRQPVSGRKSSGLGLCFVREAAELHGGTAELRNRPNAKGAIATLTLPK
ncbi:ATP-binding protein [bacterium]|nr:ATP-binding protein [bacterium]